MVSHNPYLLARFGITRQTATMNPKVVMWIAFGVAQVALLVGSEGSAGSAEYEFDTEAASVESTGNTIDLNVKPTVSNQKLQNTINELYRPGATTGNGSTADAIRHELQTGELVGSKSHILKGIQRVKNLENILRTQDLNSHDRAVAEALLQDLKNALNGK